MKVAAAEPNVGRNLRDRIRDGLRVIPGGESASRSSLSDPFVERDDTRAAHSQIALQSEPGTVHLAPLGHAAQRPDRDRDRAPHRRGQCRGIPVRDERAAAHAWTLLGDLTSPASRLSREDRNGESNQSQRLSPGRRPLRVQH